VDTKTLRVNDDPEVALTSVERKRMFDQAMEMHALQARVTDAVTAHRSLAQQIAQLSTTLAERSDVAGDVKTVFEAVKKDVDALAESLPRYNVTLTVPQPVRTDTAPARRSTNGPRG